jgi:hypothetical protein
MAITRLGIYPIREPLGCTHIHWVIDEVNPWFLRLVPNLIGVLVQQLSESSGGLLEV